MLVVSVRSQRFFLEVPRKAPNLETPSPFRNPPSGSSPDSPTPRAESGLRALAVLAARVGAGAELALDALQVAGGGGPEQRRLRPHAVLIRYGKAREEWKSLAEGRAGSCPAGGSWAVGG